MILAVTGRGQQPEPFDPHDYRVCTVIEHTEYIFNDPHLRALSAFAIIMIGVLTIMIWRHYRKEDE